MDRNPLKLSGAGAGDVVYDLPGDVYFQYQWRDSRGNTLADPQNENTAPSVWYGTVNVLTGPDYRPDPIGGTLLETHPTGTLQRGRLQSDALQQLRRVNTYTPAGFADAGLPAILVQDGTAFYRIGRLATALDAVIARGSLPARLVFLEPVSRDREYRFSNAYESFVLEELIPQLADVVGPTTDLYLLGASLGGLSAATLALRQPELFSGVATFSAALLGSPTNPDPYRSPDEWVRERIEGGAAVPDRWYVGTGTLEWLHLPNSRLAEALREAGVRLEYAERTAGHNWTAWRDMFAGALQHLLVRD